MVSNEKVPEAPTGERQQTDDRPADANEGATAGKAKAPTAQGAPESNGLPDDSEGSRGGSVLGSQSGRTGMGDGHPGQSSQGLGGAQGSGGGAERFPKG